MERLEDLNGTTWTGTKRLWFDPDAPARTSDAAITIEDGVLRYTWSLDDASHHGEVAWLRRPDGALQATFKDTFHQAQPMPCTQVDSAALLAVQYAYPAPPGPDWGWRILLYLRPADPEGAPGPTLVLQMINIYPWGEEQRAVEIAGRRTGG